MARMPVRARNVLSTVEQIKREAKRSVQVLIIGQNSDDGLGLQSILSSGEQGLFPILSWEEARTKAAQKRIKSADAILFLADPTSDMKEQAKKMRDIMKLNSSYLIAIDQKEHPSELQQQLESAYAGLDRHIKKVILISQSKNINIEGKLASDLMGLLYPKGKGIPLARRSPIFRGPVVANVIDQTSRQNGLIGVMTFLPGADMPILTANQIRMVLKIAAVYDEEISFTRLRELFAVVGAGFTLRGLARQLLDFVPGIGWVVKGAVAFAGTEALGRVAQKYFEQGYSRMNTEDMRQIFSSIKSERNSGRNPRKAGINTSRG